MTPEKYVHTLGMAGPKYIVRTIIWGKPTIVSIHDGVQPKEGTIHPTLKDAREDMRRNGFVSIG